MSEKVDAQFRQAKIFGGQNCRIFQNIGAFCQPKILSFNPIMGGGGGRSAKFAVPSFFLIIHDEEFNFLTHFFLLLIFWIDATFLKKSRKTGKN